MFHILSRQTTFGRDLMNGDLLEMARPAVRSSRRSRWGSTPVNQHSTDILVVMVMIMFFSWSHVRHEDIITGDCNDNK